MGEKLSELDDTGQGAPEVGNLVFVEPPREGKEAVEKLENEGRASQKWEPTDGKGHDNSHPKSENFTKRGLALEGFSEEKAEEGESMVELHLLVVEGQGEGNGANDVMVCHDCNDGP